MSIWPNPIISEASIVLAQDEDSAGRTGEESQDITVRWVDAGGGLYPTIETKRWALDLDDMAELQELIRDFGKRMDTWNKKQEQRTARQQKSEDRSNPKVVKTQVRAPMPAVPARDEVQIETEPYEPAPYAPAPKVSSTDDIPFLVVDREAALTSDQRTMVEDRLANVLRHKSAKPNGQVL